MYAIRQISTGYYLPQIKYKKGYTHSKPEKDCLPRLFKRKSDATRALNIWLEGKMEYMRIAGNWVQPESYELVTTPCKERSLEDMQVVFVSIHCCLPVV